MHKKNILFLNIDWKTKIMTLGDFLKRTKYLPTDKMMLIIDDNGGWSNINIKIEEEKILIMADRKPLFSDD